MTQTKRPIRLGSAAAFIWLAFGFANSACVAKPEFHCQSDASCVSADGSKGICQANGECSFHATPAAQGGASGGSGAPASGAGLAGSDDAPSSGGDDEKGGTAGEPDAAGDAGAAGAASPSCTDEADNCYSCKPTTSEQFLNACTSSACVPFDDHTRITTLTASGDLPALPAVSGQ